MPVTEEGKIEENMMERQLVCKYGCDCGHEFCMPEQCSEWEKPETPSITPSILKENTMDRQEINGDNIHPMVKTHKCTCGNHIRVLSKIGKYLLCKKCAGTLFPLDVESQDRAWKEGS